MTPLEWARIGKALEYYTQHGYEYMEVPWVVSYEHHQSTIPQDVRQLHQNYGIEDLHIPAWNKYLIASGEQSFVELLEQGIKIRNAVCVTPCFRNEILFDKYHLPYFMKVELISTIKPTEEVMNDVQSFVRTCTDQILITLETTGGYDFLLNEIEIGSYGCREFRGHHWIYGTGLAEPRFSQAMLKQ